MIKITIIKNGDDIITLEAKGHSGYAVEGSDIICSAVSTLTQNCIKSLKELLNINIDYRIDINIPNLYVKLPDIEDKKLMSSAQLLLKSCYVGLVDLAESYPKYISIKENQI